MHFSDKLNNGIDRTDSLLCVGLDPIPNKIPVGVSTAEFLQEIINSTADIACAYKPNIAFFEAMGEQGMQILRETLEAIPAATPVILDAKRGDIGNTAEAYASAVFDYLKVDAVTVNPYMGYDSIEPVIKRKGKGVIILCHTSNPGSADFQQLTTMHNGKQVPLYEAVAEKASQWNKNNNIGLVIGATYPQEIARLRLTHPDMLFLVPGAGTQGGNLKEAVKGGRDKSGRGIIINASRQVLYASQGADFAEKARGAALALRDEINRYRQE